MKIIFLDIDGVLNYPKMPDQEKRDFGAVSKGCVELLNKLTDETGAKIVVSSTWRRDHPRHGTMAKRLHDLGVIGECIGITPCMDDRGVFRGNEIYRWMLDNEHIVGKHPYKFKNYVILDDDTDMLLWQKDNFINVDRWTGLTPAVVHKAKRILAT